jgi:hypothetical protein
MVEDSSFDKKDKHADIGRLDWAARGYGQYRAVSAREDAMATTLVPPNHSMLLCHSLQLLKPPAADGIGLHGFKELGGGVHKTNDTKFSIKSSLFARLPASAHTAQTQNEKFHGNRSSACR